MVETLSGHTTHLTASREDVAITFKKQSVYEDGSSKLQGVTVVFDERNGGARTFTITGNDGRLSKGATTMVLDGAVRLEGSDGMTVLTEHATFNVDRTPRNANLLNWHRQLYFIDHGAALYWQHDRVEQR